MRYFFKTIIKFASSKKSASQNPVGLRRLRSLPRHPKSYLRPQRQNYQICRKLETNKQLIPIRKKLSF